MGHGRAQRCRPAAKTLDFSLMESKLAKEAERALIEATQRLSPEERLNAFLVHCRLIMDLYQAGRQMRVCAEATSCCWGSGLSMQLMTGDVADACDMVRQHGSADALARAAASLREDQCVEPSAGLRLLVHANTHLPS